MHTSNISWCSISLSEENKIYAGLVAEERSSDANSIYDQDSGFKLNFQKSSIENLPVSDSVVKTIDFFVTIQMHFWHVILWQPTFSSKLLT